MLIEKSNKEDELTFNGVATLNNNVVRYLQLVFVDCCLQAVSHSREQVEKKKKGG